MSRTYFGRVLLLSTLVMLIAALPAGASTFGRGAELARPLLAGGPVVTPRGVGALRLGATIGTLDRRHLIGGVRNGCELDPGQRIAPLRGPLTGWAVFADGGARLSSIDISGGAETGLHVGIGSSAAQARAAYPRADFVPPNRSAPLPDGILWVNHESHPQFTFLIDPYTRRVESISIPSPSFCE